MSYDGGATSEGPGRRRESWSLKNIVEDIAGKPLSDLQDPDRPTHPYLKVKGGGFSPSYRSITSPALPTPARAAAADVETITDPIDRVYPPLTGETGRTLHGPEHEHHSPTLDGVATVPGDAEPGRARHAPGPSQRPERIYLHYLLLHMDRLNDHALQYLKHAVDEELGHRGSRPKSLAEPDPSTS